MISLPIVPQLYPDTPPPEYQSVEEVNHVTVAVTDCDSKPSCPFITIEKVNPAKEGKINVQTSFNDLTFSEKIRSIVISILKPICLLVILYFFVCSLDLLSSAFRLVGGRAAGSAMQRTQLLENPIAGLMIGVMATVLVQSSSTSTSIVVTMVASGIIRIQPAIYIIMGANIGTSLTNTLVSMAQVNNRKEFELAFAGATVHDMFNWLSVFILLPLEVTTEYLQKLSGLCVSKLNDKSTVNYGERQDFLKAITKPLTELIIKLDKDVIKDIAAGKNSSGKTLLKQWCKYGNISVSQNYTAADSLLNETYEMIGIEKCKFLFNTTSIPESAIGSILLILSLFCLCTCLILLVKLLHSSLQGTIIKFLKRYINAELPGKFAFLTGYIAIICGALLTVLLQSSSVFTSALTPLVGLGVLNLDRMYPLTLGSNIGTTATSLLAAFAASRDMMKPAVQIALCHLLFNFSGIILFYPLPFMRFPIPLAKFMGKITAEYRWFALVYTAGMFFFLPAVIFGLSLIGPIAVYSVVAILFSLLLIVGSLNFIQKRKPEWLPNVLKNWKFVPLFLRSLRPYDKLLQKLCPFQRCHENRKEEIELEFTSVQEMVILKTSPI